MPQASRPPQYTSRHTAYAGPPISRKIRPARSQAAYTPVSTPAHTMPTLSGSRAAYITAAVSASGRP